MLVYHKRINVVSLVWFMVFNATFNNISVISWRSVLLVEETGVPGENHRPASRRNVKTRNMCITKYARLYKLSNGIMVMTPK